MARVRRERAHVGISQRAVEPAEKARAEGICAERGDGGGRGGVCCGGVGGGEGGERVGGVAGAREERRVGNVKEGRGGEGREERRGGEGTGVGERGKRLGLRLRLCWCWRRWRWRAAWGARGRVAIRVVILGYVLLIVQRGAAGLFETCVGVYGSGCARDERCAVGEPGREPGLGCGRGGCADEAAAVVVGRGGPA